LTGQPAAADSIPWVNSVFEQPWWLDAVAPGQWNAVVVREAGDVVARLPYVLRQRLGLRTIGLPPITPTLGPWLAPIAGGNARRYDAEKERLGRLVEMLPPFDHFNVNMTTSLSNCLPFLWAGFHATVRYTYRLEDLADLERIEAGFQEPIRRGIRKASRTLEIRPDHPVEDLIRLDSLTYGRQGLAQPVSPDTIRRVQAACAARGAGTILGAVDAKGRTHAAVSVAWDADTFFLLISARDPDLQAFGTNALLYWEAIKLATGLSRAFDFEGSIIEPIEHYLRGFGGNLTPYFGISRTTDRARAALAVRKVWRRIRGGVPGLRRGA
jgi:hypothetical protein